MKHKIALAISTAALWMGHAQAAPFQGVVPEKSSITFSYKQMGVSMDGKFRKFSTQLNFDPAKIEQAKGSIDIELASIDTGSAEADEEVVGKAWFNVAAFPKASFVLKQLKATGPDQYEATGQLSIKGQTRDMRTPLKLSKQGTQSLLSGSFVLKRNDFGIGEGMWAKTDVVANEITINFQLNLK